MDIEQIRNATVRIKFAGKTFLMDPWLVEKGGFGTFKQTPYHCVAPEQETIPMPMRDLPMPREEVLAGVDAYIVTHIHPDHIDMAPDGTVGRFLDKTVPVFVQNTEDAYAFVRSGFKDVNVLYENSAYGPVRLIRTPGRHGTKIPCGPSCGVLFSAPGEKTLYVAGDTIWYDGVKKVLETYRPDVVLVNACAAELVVEGRLIMNDADIAEVRKVCPAASLVVSHMDTVAHASLTRASMRVLLRQRGLQAFMPEDGEKLTF